MPICEICARPLSWDAERIVLPQGKGVMTICMPCATRKRPRLDEGQVVVLPDETVSDGAGRDNT